MKEIGEHYRELVERFDDTADEILPLNDNLADTYRNLTGAWVVGGAYVGAKALEWVEKTPIASKPALVVGTVAVASIPSLVAGVLWRQSWRAAGE